VPAACRAGQRGLVLDLRADAAMDSLSMNDAAVGTWTKKRHGNLSSLFLSTRITLPFGQLQTKTVCCAIFQSKQPEYALEAYDGNPPTTWWGAYQGAFGHGNRLDSTIYCTNMASNLDDEIIHGELYPPQKEIICTRHSNETP